MSQSPPAQEEEVQQPADGRIKLKRVSVACKRCRRLREKCVHQGKEEPCTACVKAGLSSQCFYPARGTDSSDRQFRRKRARTSVDTATEDRVVSSAASSARAATADLQVSTPTDGRQNAATGPEALVEPRAAVVAPINVARRTSSSASHRVVARADVVSEPLLPSHEELVEGIKAFCTSYFQLGFLPRAYFLEQIARDRDAISPFLLLAILSLSARFAPTLVARYGGKAGATNLFLRRAYALLPDELFSPSVQRAQAFFLLATAEWGNGEGERSSMLMGNAVRMAGLLRLHREETYALDANAGPDDVIAAEVARRTFWMIQSQDDLHSGAGRPLSFVLTDINAGLPCEEREFAFGIRPRERSTLAGTAAAQHASPAATVSPSQPLFATLIQAHNLWGKVARLASARGTAELPWDETSQNAKLRAALAEWEAALPPQHRWSALNLRGFMSEGLDLAYLGVVMIVKLSAVVLRRMHLPLMAQALDTSGASPFAAEPHARHVLVQLCREMMSHGVELFEMIDAYFPLRGKEEGFPAIMVFCVYVCGSLASYLYRWPQFCPEYAMRAESMLRCSLRLLTDLQDVWPVAAGWLDALHSAALNTAPVHAGADLTETAATERTLDVQVGLYRDGNASGSAQNSPASSAALPSTHSSHNNLQAASQPWDLNAAGILAQGFGAPAPRLADGVTFFPNIPAVTSPLDLASVPLDSFDADLSAFLEGEVPSFGGTPAWPWA